MIDAIKYNQLLTMAYHCNMLSIRFEHHSHNLCSEAWKNLSNVIENAATMARTSDKWDAVPSLIMAQWKIEKCIVNSPAYDHMRETGDICIAILVR